jgi:hypothetical protein
LEYRMAKVTTRPQDLLRDLVYPGITEDVFEARQALALVRAIGRHAAGINSAAAGALFRPVQLSLWRQVHLSLAKMYEPPNDRYPTVSIPSVLKHLEEHSAALRFEQRSFAIDKLSASVFKREALERMSDQVLTRTLVGHLRTECPDVSRAGFDEASLALAGIKTQRDKVIAHNERVDRTTLRQATLDESEKLVAFGETFVMLVAQSYLGLIFEFADGNRPFFETDATRSVRALERLVQSLATRRD